MPPDQPSGTLWQPLQLLQMTFRLFFAPLNYFKPSLTIKRNNERRRASRGMCCLIITIWQKVRCNDMPNQTLNDLSQNEMLKQIAVSPLCIHSLVPQVHFRLVLSNMSFDVWTQSLTSLWNFLWADVPLLAMNLTPQTGHGGRGMFAAVPEGYRCRTGIGRHITQLSSIWKWGSLINSTDKHVFCERHAKSAKQNSAEQKQTQTCNGTKSRTVFSNLDDGTWTQACSFSISQQ